MRSHSAGSGTHRNRNRDRTAVVSRRRSRSSRLYPQLPPSSGPPTSRFLLAPSALRGLSQAVGSKLTDVHLLQLLALLELDAIASAPLIASSTTPALSPISDNMDVFEWFCHLSHPLTYTHFHGVKDDNQTTTGNVSAQGQTG